MSLGGIAPGRQRQHVPIIVHRHRIEIGVHPSHHIAVALGGAAAHIRQHLGRGGGSRLWHKAHPDMIKHSRLTGRVDLTGGKLGQEYAALQPGSGPHTDPVAGLQRLVDGIQHVKVHRRQSPPALFPRQPDQRRGRMTIAVVRVKRMAMHVHPVARRLAGYPIVDARLPHRLQRPPSRLSIRRHQFPSRICQAHSPTLPR